jgi:N-methylhydantoinase A/oxoprolinase/acetone carboxylase beta subunit
MVFMEPLTERLVIDRAQFNETVSQLIARARQDLVSEGLNVADAVFSLELDMLYGGQVNLKRAASPRVAIESDADALAVYDAFEKEFSEAFSPLVVNKPGGVFLDNFVLRVTVPTWKPEVPVYELQGEDPSAALLGRRQAYWPELKSAGSAGQWVDTPTYQFEQLQPGNLVLGPAVVEAELTTITVPPGSKFAIEKHGLGILEAVNPPPPRKRIAASVAVAA